MFCGFWDKWLLWREACSPTIWNWIFLMCISLFQIYVWVSESKWTARYVYWNVQSGSTHCSQDVIDGLSAKSNLHALIEKTNHCERRSIKLSEISRGSMLHDACPPLVGPLKLFNVLQYWRVSLTDMPQPRAAVFYVKMRETWCLFFSVSPVTLDTPISPSHSVTTSPLSQSWLCSPPFEVSQECSANSWPQENKMSLESAMCQIG